MAAPTESSAMETPESDFAVAHTSVAGPGESSLDTRDSTRQGSTLPMPQTREPREPRSAAPPCGPPRRLTGPEEQPLTLSQLPEEMALLMLRHVSRCDRLRRAGRESSAACYVGGPEPRRSSGFGHALVCSTWRALAPEAQEHVTVREGAALAREQLSCAAMPFPNLASFSFTRASLEELSPDLLVGLVQEFPKLTHLRVPSEASLAPCAASSSAETLIAAETLITALAAETPRLKSLVLEGLMQRSGIPDSIAAMRCLETLVLEGAEVLYVSPALSQLSALKTLKLKCTQRGSIQTLFRGLQRVPLKELSLDVMYLRELPAEIGGLTSLTKLDLLGNAIRELPLSILKLTGLRCLSLRCCQLERLPDALGPFGGLRSLVLATPKLIALPHSVSSFTRLTSLRVEAQDLPLLWLQGLDTLKALHIGNLKATALALDFAPFTQLQSLTLDCPELKTLPSGLDGPNRLRHLDISSCRDVRLPVDPDCPADPDCPVDSDCPASGFASVTRLYVGEALSSCFEQPGVFSAVTELHISNLHQSEIPGAIRGLARLSLLRLECCWKVVSLDAVLRGVPSLRQVSIKFCRLLEELCGPLSADVALQKLSIEHCRSLKKLPAGFHRFKSLALLVLKDCASFESFPDMEGSQDRLARVSLANCARFASLPGSFSNAKGLQELSLMNLPSLSSLPESFGQLQQLRLLVLESLPLLQALPESSQNLRSLSSLAVTGCPQLTLGHLSALPSLSTRSRGLVPQRTG